MEKPTGKVEYEFASPVNGRLVSGNNGGSFILNRFGDPLTLSDSLVSSTQVPPPTPFDLSNPNLYTAATGNEWNIPTAYTAYTISYNPVNNTIWIGFYDNAGNDDWRVYEVDLDTPSSTATQRYVATAPDSFKKFTYFKTEENFETGGYALRNHGTWNSYFYESTSSNEHTFSQSTGTPGVWNITKMKNGDYWVANETTKAHRYTSLGVYTGIAAQTGHQAYAGTRNNFSVYNGKLFTSTGGGLDPSFAIHNVDTGSRIFPLYNPAFNWVSVNNGVQPVNDSQAIAMGTRFNGVLGNDSCFALIDIENANYKLFDLAAANYTESASGQTSMFTWIPETRKGYVMWANYQNTGKLFEFEILGE